MTRPILRMALTAGLAALCANPSAAEDARTAKQLFGAQTLPSTGAATPLGFYAKGCMSGAVALPTDGPTWQAMRLSRNRRWGNPAMISLLEQFSRDAVKVGWGSGILVGDISQPRGGPMITGHASHQIGLDADIWFQPKPRKALSPQERESFPFVSMLDKSKFLTVNPERWTAAHMRVVMLAASYPQVQRVFVNPAIKKKLCDTWTGDRNLLGKVRPIYGHDEHFHIRMTCPPGVTSCERQAAVPPGDDCGANLAYWFTDKPWKPAKPDPNKKPVKPRQVMLSDLPKACAAVLASAPRSEADATYAGGAAGVSESVGAASPRPTPIAPEVPLPSVRPEADAD